MAPEPNLLRGARRATRVKISQYFFIVYFVLLGSTIHQNFKAIPIFTVEILRLNQIYSEARRAPEEKKFYKNF
jgi:hypothetical protein